jgi:ABC-type uncharacterized transport system permease subunit
VLANGTKLNSGVFLAVGAAVLIYIYLTYRRAYYEARMAGDAFLSHALAGSEANGPS